MTIEQLLGLSGEDLEKISDEEMLKILQTNNILDPPLVNPNYDKEEDSESTTNTNPAGTGEINRTTNKKTKLTKKEKLQNQINETERLMADMLKSLEVPEVK